MDKIDITTDAIKGVIAFTDNKFTIAMGEKLLQFMEVETKVNSGKKAGPNSNERTIFEKACNKIMLMKASDEGIPHKAIYLAMHIAWKQSIEGDAEFVTMSTDECTKACQLISNSGIGAIRKKAIDGGLIKYEGVSGTTPKYSFIL